jgi:2-polyprenyl-6-methoxyphenol hydroxylase-like FAD-dependent oxidoreductase
MTEPTPATGPDQAQAQAPPAPGPAVLIVGAGPVGLTAAHLLGSLGVRVLLVERNSTGRNESTTHLVLQLELNGLSTLGTGSPRFLKDNVPGYQPLRNDPGASAESTNSQ